MMETTEQTRTVPYTYESSEVFLSMVQAEYQNGIERAASIDTKLSISLPIVSTYLFSIVQYSSLPAMLKPVNSRMLGGFIILLYALMLSCAAVSLVLMVVSVSAHNYETVDMRMLNNAEQMSLPREQYCAAISGMYINASFRNAMQNNKRGYLHILGWVGSAISLACFVLLVLITG